MYSSFPTTSVQKKENVVATADGRPANGNQKERPRGLLNVLECQDPGIAVDRNHIDALTLYRHPHFAI